jgi:ABC-type uncharacterized transport system ATPase subunit
MGYAEDIIDEFEDIEDEETPEEREHRELTTNVLIPHRYVTMLVKEYDRSTGWMMLYHPSVGEISYHSLWIVRKQERVVLSDNYVKDGPPIYVRLRRQGREFIKGGTILYEEIDKPTFTQLSAVVTTPLEYVNYSISGLSFNVQRDGILVLCGTSGSGKTYNALHNIQRLLKVFDEVLYLNWEVTENDIKQRVLTGHVPSFDGDRLFLSQTQNIKQVTSWMGTKNVAVIVDNIDNLIGAGENQYQEQLAFIKELDKYVKENNQHALILTQHIKDSKMSLFKKDGSWSDIVNLSLLSGVKQIGDMSRSAIFTSYFDGDVGAGYKTKIIKKGSGLYDSEIKALDSISGRRL